MGGESAVFFIHGAQGQCMALADVAARPRSHFRAGWLAGTARLVRLGPSALRRCANRSGAVRGNGIAPLLSEPLPGELWTVLCDLESVCGERSSTACDQYRTHLQLEGEVARRNADLARRNSELQQRWCHLDGPETSCSTANGSRRWIGCRKSHVEINNPGRQHGRALGTHFAKPITSLATEAADHRTRWHHHRRRAHGNRWRC